MQQKFINIPTTAEDREKLPKYASGGAAGADVRAHVLEDLVIAPGTAALIPTGLRMAIPEGYEIQIRPRSGLALKNQITVLNTPGTVDSDYRGEIGVILMNHSKENFVVKPGMRIAQFVLAPVFQANFVVTDELVETNRGAGGFGHTGMH